MFTTRPELLGTFGMVATTHWLASAVGMSILEAGGNAFDAAVATGLTLHVVEPHLNGPGGDCPIIGHHGRSNDTFVICGQGTAPSSATRTRFNELGLDLIPGTGLLPAVVPGAFGAWMELLLLHGTLPLRTIMSPAIHYARHGYPIVQQAVSTIATVEEIFRDHWPSSAEIYLPGGKVPRPGSLFRNVPLARTFERILAESESTASGHQGQIEAARQSFYEGFVAERLIDFTSKTAVMDNTGEPHSGLLAFDDLSHWRATYEKPQTLNFRGYTVCKTGPWGQGPVLLQQLSLLSTLDLDDTAPGSAELVHAIIEGAKLSFADREAYYGDPKFVDVPIDDLLTLEYSLERANLIAATAALGMQAGSVGNSVPKLADYLSTNTQSAPASAGTGEPTVSPAGLTRGDTCHLDVADKFGNLVSATPSGGWLQSSPVVPGLGFALPTRGQMFWLEEGLPNSLQPGKRPRTTLSPAMLLRDGAPYLAFGTPGGDQQDQWTIPFLLNHIVYGMNLQEAIDAPNYHSTDIPSSFFPRTREPFGVHVESRLDDNVIDELRGRGHRVTVNGPWSLGRVSAAGIRPDGLLVSGANARGMQGYAVGR